MTRDLVGREVLSTPAGACWISGGAVHHDEGGLLVALIGQPRWLGPGGDRLPRAEVASRIAAAYRADRTSVPGNLRGDFAVVILDVARRSLTACIDRIGIHQFYYAVLSGGLVFGTAPGFVSRHPSVTSEIDHQAIHDYVFFHMVPSPGTIYCAQRKLPGAHMLRCDDGSPSVTRYWVPQFRETDSGADGARMLEIIRQAVARSLADAPGKVGAFLSGGLDSSTVAGVLSDLTGKANTYTIGFAAAGYDEMEFARTTSSHFGTQSHEYYVTPEDVAGMVRGIASACDEPFGNSSALPTFYCAKLAREDGVSRLLAGDGGDEIFAGNARYAQQRVFERWGLVPRFMRNVIEVMVPDRGGIWPLDKARSYIRQANMPLPDRLDSYNFLFRNEPSAVFTPEFLASVATTGPMTLKRSVYRTPPDATPLNRMLYLDWHFTLHDNDLVKVNTACRLADVDVAYPLLDDDLLEFSTCIPTNLKLRHGELRWFYKNAMRGYLPERTLRKSKHGFGLPFGLWMRTDAELREIAHGSLMSLEARGWFRPEFLRESIARHESQHASYYGELVWILMMLELWCQAHSPGAETAHT